MSASAFGGVLAALHMDYCLLLLPLQDGTCEPHAAVIAYVVLYCTCLSAALSSDRE